MGLLTVAANGQSLTVDLHRPGGSRPSTFSDAGLTTPITLPLAITADQDFYFRSGTNIVTVTVTTAAGVVLLSSVQHEVGDTDHVVVTPLPTAAQEAATDSAASGGSVAGAMTAADFLFTEVADAGVYEATLDLAAGSLVRDVQVFMLEAPWAADTAALDVIDPRSAAGNGYADAADLLSTSDTSISADLTQPFSAEDDWSNGYSDLRGLNGNWHGLGLVGNDAGTGVYYGTAETVTVRVTTTNAAPVTPTAVMLVRVLYQPPVTADVPVFTPAV